MRFPHKSGVGVGLGLESPGELQHLEGEVVRKTR